MPAGRHRMTKKPNTKPVKRHDPKHIDFVQDYFYGEHKGDAKNSLIAAGYTARYAQTYAHHIVGEHRSNSINKTLWDLVQAEREKIGEQYGITEQWVMDGYIRDESFDPIHLVNDEGLPETDLRKIPKDIRLSLKGLKVRQQIMKSIPDPDTGEINSQVIKQTTEFQYPDKKGNRDSIAKILGMMNEKLVLPGADKIEKIAITFVKAVIVDNSGELS